MSKAPMVGRNGPMIIVKGGQREALEQWRHRTGLDEEIANRVWENASQVINELREGQWPPVMACLVGLAIFQLAATGGHMPKHKAAELANDQLPLLWEIAMRVSDAAGPADEQPDLGGAIETITKPH